MTILAEILAFLKAAPATARGVMTAAEWVRTILAALSTGGVGAVITAVLGLLNYPDVAGLAAVLTPLITAAVGVVDYLRRKYLHGPVA